MADKGYAFLIVGHSNFGKSETLWALTDYAEKRGKQPPCTIAGVDFFVRRMSNDDAPYQNPRSYEEFVEAIGAEPERYRNFISAFCPRFSEKKTERFLSAFKERHDVYAMVIRQSHKGDATVSDEEIALLSKYLAPDIGVLIFSKFPHTRDQRAGVFRGFIARTVANVVLDDE